ncbi:MAG: S1 RNA-binding domain-containing protein [Chloroflexi bacterium]|nr:S1 RNA-binding domain-containing protein [Chloroflexota bacterium]
MSEFKPWEESPDEGYWNAVLTARGSPAEGEGESEAADAPSSGAGWGRAEKSYAEGETLELRVVGHNRGGLLVDLGDVRGFVPASQLINFPRQMPDDQRMQELGRCVGTTLRVKVIEFDRARNRLILSERVANPPVSHAEQALASIQPQQTRTGIVRNITDFGAFIDLGGVEGLIHVSELSWQYVKHPREVLTPGQEVQVFIMDVNRDQKRIACSLKRLTSNPWSMAAEKLHPGDLVDGVITSVVPFGAFVRVGDGVEGLVHVSELANGSFLHPRDVVQEGQMVQVRVIDVDPEQQRLRLSLRLAAGGTGVQYKRDREATRPTGGPGGRMPPPPPADPGYWESLAQSGM